MASKSAIEWTDATWNPVRGCSRITTGCGGPNHEGGCYAEKIAARFSDPGQPFHGFAERTKHGGRWTGKLALIEDALTLPLRWRKPRRIFVNSMSDLFHENLPDEAVDRVFAVMALCPQHTFQVLTKRAERMREYVPRCDKEIRHIVAAQAMVNAGLIERGRDIQIKWPLPNVWLGVSAERQEEANERIPHLLDTSAAIRFLSLEPLLGPIDLGKFHIGWSRCQSCGEACDPNEEYPLGQRTYCLDCDGALEVDGHHLHWVIAGGESGSRARPMHPDWARSLRDQCEAAEIPFFFKQHGEWIGVLDLRNLTGGKGPGFGAFDHCRHDMNADAVRVGKKAAGRLLDGVTHDGFPEVRT